MAAGDLTASTPIECSTMAELVAAVGTLNLAATTDRVFIIPIVYRVKTPTSLYATRFIVFKVERAA